MYISVKILNNPLEKEHPGEARFFNHLMEVAVQLKELDTVEDHMEFTVQAYELIHRPIEACLDLWFTNQMNDNNCSLRLLLAEGDKNTTYTLENVNIVKRGVEEVESTTLTDRLIKFVQHNITFSGKLINNINQ